MQANNRILECRVRETCQIEKNNVKGAFIFQETIFQLGKHTCFKATDVATLSIQIFDAIAPGPSTEDERGGKMTIKFF